MQQKQPGSIFLNSLGAVSLKQQVTGIGHAWLS